MTEHSIRARLIRNEEHFTEVLSSWALSSNVSLWIATANLKELRIPAPIGTRARARGTFVSVLESLGELVRRGVELRILHGGIPSRPFRSELARHPELQKSGVLRMCPRVHLKLVVGDGARAYIGSANFTGAGFGAKGAGRRNFEMGIVTDHEHILDEAQATFDRIWSGKECGACKLRGECPAPLDGVSKGAKKRTSPARTISLRRQKIQG